MTHPSPDYCIVTGAAGFIGSHLVDRLLKRGDRVLGLDNFVRGSLPNLSSAVQHPSFTFMEVNLNDEPGFAAALGSAPGQPSMLWHLAANSDIAAGGADPDLDLRDTFLTTYVAAKMCRRFHIRRLLFASTSAVYGDHGPIALREDLGPLFPISNYGAMKLSGEATLTALSEGHLDHLWIARFPNVIGPRATHGVIYDFLDKLERTPSSLEVLGDGTQCKPYLYVDDLVDALLYMTQHANARINCFNIGPDDEGISVREIAEAVVAHAAPGAAIRYGSEPRGWVGDVPRFHYSIAKLAKLGWSPTHSSSQAVRQAIAAQVAERRERCP